MTQNKPTVVPARAIHPGEILKDEIVSRGIKQKELAELTGIQPSQLNEIIKGKRNINTETAKLLGAALEMDPALWINLQTNYDLQKIQVEEKFQKRLQAIDLWNTIKLYIPVSFFRKKGVISGDPVIDIPVIRRIYTIKNIEELISLFSMPQYARFRKSDKLPVEKINLLGWQHLVADYAKDVKVAEFKIEKEEALIKELKQIISKNKNTIDLSRKALSKAGIKLVILEKPDKCPVDGISFNSDKNPAIALTMRHKRLDNFAFTLMHELGHVYKHLTKNQTAIFIDLDPKEEEKIYSSSPEEQEANEYASDKLINREDWRTFIASRRVTSEIEIIRFAEKQRIHPAIVKGKIRFETGNYSLFGKLPEVKFS